jgi:excisionase family DNA binding protein
VLDAVIADLAERVAAAVVSRLGATQEQVAAEWLDSREAAAYLGVHRDTLRKLAAERAIPTHQDGRGGKLFFRRSDLDEWRRSGGRPAHLSAVVTQAA